MLDVEKLVDTAKNGPLQIPKIRKPWVHYGWPGDTNAFLAESIACGDLIRWRLAPFGHYE
jgi:hypothetical protein